LEIRIIESTSASSATCSDVVLRTTATSRLVFRPELVNNPHDIAASVRGTFIYQRKTPKETWEDGPTDSLAKLKSGEGYQLEIKSAELLTLMGEVDALYKLHAKGGVPMGITELVAVDSTVAKLAGLPRAELQAYLSAHEAVGAQLLATLLDWVGEVHEPAALVPRLLSLGPAALRNLNVAVGLRRLKDALETWADNEGNPEEEFWQETLTEHSFVLEQVFAWPMVVVKGKAYVGGKSVFNTGGNLADFLVKNYFTSNAALLEIKTPAAALLNSKPYRDSVFNPSWDLMGAVQQVQNYRASLLHEFQAIKVPGLEAFDPRCVVIIGATSQLAFDEDMSRSFELYRASVSGVTIITFDELFEKTERLVHVLETAA
jgi:hypothetical protein